MRGLSPCLCAGLAAGLCLSSAGAAAAPPAGGEAARTTLPVGAVVEPSCRVASGGEDVQVSCSAGVAWTASAPQPERSAPAPAGDSPRTSRDSRYVTISY